MMFRKIFTFLFISLAFFVAPAQSAEELGIKIVSSLDIKRSMDGGVRMFIIDVRSEEDFKKGHVKNALNLPIERLNEKSLSRLIKSKDERVIFYSESNETNESRTAAERAVLFGYTKVYRYIGGIEAWRNAGFTVVNYISD